MHRFYCPDLPAARHAAAPAGGSARLVTLDGEQAHHARRVLRLEGGAPVAVFNGRGTVGEGTIESWLEGRMPGPREAGGAVVRLTQTTDVPAPVPALDIAAAIPKGLHAEDMVAQLSQLGADRLIPLRTRRSVVDPRPAKRERFVRAAIESAKQCGRAYLMTVAEPADLATVLAEQHDLRLLAAPGAPALPDLPARLRAVRRVLVLIGPEGGWAEEELAAARQAGALPWRLGPLVLRIETAAAAAAAVVRYLAEGAAGGYSG